ncbi:MAG: PEP-CTERM sorting domain-containing protein [Verrucomicrobia bacterium]|nr:PEP-CTERM sorting domain-containing protein [Verrucomicrobiota bacterium]
MRKIIAVTMIAMGMALGASAAPIEWWDMNDTAGTDLNDLANSGSINSIWNFNTVGAVTDGSGNFVIDGDSGVTTRKLPKKGSATADAGGLLDIYAAPLTTGAYSLTVDFASWNFDAASEGDLWKLKTTDSAGTDIAGIELGIIGGAGRIRLWSNTSGGAAYRSFAYNPTEAAGALVEVRFDFDNNTVDYVVDGNVEYSFTDFIGSNIGGMAYTTSGDTTADWATAASSVSIDAMGIDVIPEPATVGMLGLGALVTMFVRRFKRR